MDEKQFYKLLDESLEMITRIPSGCSIKVSVDNILNLAKIPKEMIENNISNDYKVPMTIEKTPENTILDLLMEILNTCDNKIDFINGKVNFY